MYKRHSIWDEDKLDIHSSGSGYAGHGPEDKGVGYAGHGSKDSVGEYHKNELYNVGKTDEDKIKGSYTSQEHKDEDKKKEDEQKEKTIVDAVEQEEKYKKEEDQDEFQTIAKTMQHGMVENEQLENKDNKISKKKNNKSIEDAINSAIKEEKEIVHVD